MTLHEQINVYNALRGQLILSGYDFTEYDQALLDTLEGETDLHEQITAVIRAAQLAEAYAAGMAEIIKDNRERKERHELRAEKLRKLAFDTMQGCGIPKVESADLTITVAKGVPHVIVTDIALVPNNLCKFSRIPEKMLIKEALRFGPVSGAELSNAEPVLKVRTK